MKLIALRSFRNNTEPRIELDGAKHDNHIHKGAIFSIGIGKDGKDIVDADKLSKTDERNIGLLQMSGCVGDATDEKLVKKIQAQVAEEDAAESRAKKSVAAGSNADIVAQLVAALKSVAAAK
jgi:hypothetical protein